jgi:PleD family two-component response regulator
MLKDKLRWVDIVGCWEKDEFMLVLPETALEPALRLTRKIEGYCTRLLLAEDRVGGTEVSLDVGCAAWTRGDDAAALLQRIEDDIGSRAAGHHDRLATP